MHTRSSARPVGHPLWALGRLSALLLLAAGTCLAALAPGRSDDLEEDQTLHMDWETPHTDWAQPYALGKIRVLYFTSVPFSGDNYCKARQMVELMQRFDVQAKAVYWVQIADSPSYQWHGGEAGVRRMRRLLQQRWDCFFFDRLPLSQLAVEDQYTLLQAVTEGAGLVFVGTDDGRVLKPERRIEPLPTFLAPAQPEGAYAVKRGRGVRFGPPPETPYRLGWQAAYDYWQERLGRAVLWAAGRVPEVDLSAQSVAPVLQRSALPQDAVTVSWRQRGTARALTFSAGLRSDDGRVTISLGRQARAGAEGSLRYRIPVLPAGAYHLDVCARSGRGAEAFAAEGFTVVAPRGVKALDLDRDWGEVGGTISGRLTLAGDPLAGERVRVQLADPHGRVLARQEMPPGGPQQSFHFQVAPWAPMLVRVEAVILERGALVASDYRFFRVVNRHRGQHNFLAWDSPSGPLSPYVEQGLAQLGVTVQLVWRNPPSEAAANGVAWVPYSTRITADRDTNGIMLPACWNDEPRISAHVRKVVSDYTPSRRHGVFVYSLGDETATRGSCLHPACLAAFRSYLRAQYRDIAALNAEWGTQYASFDAVELSEPTDNEGAAALRAKNYPRWYDRQAFQCHNFVQLCKRFGDAYRAIDPQARTGFEGAGTLDAGDDFDLIVRTNGFWSPYPGPGDEIIRSIAPPGFIRSNWMGYTKDATSLLAPYWRMILRGCDSVWWWMWPNMGRFNGLLRPTLSPYPAVREIVKDTQVVRDGLGTLLMRSRMQDDGIAILYSMPSVYAARVEAGPSYGSPERIHDAWHKAIRELGLQFRYVTDRMLRLGEFDAKRFKVLILPRVEAIGPQEAAQVRRFVEGGGTLIADVRPGLYDGHCRPLAEGALDDLFGIAREGNVDSALGPADVGNGATPLHLAQTTCDPAVRVAGGKAAGRCGSTPLAITRRHGKGRAILLNFTILSYPDLAQPKTAPAAERFVAGLFADAGVRPKVRVLDAQGRRERNVEVVRWQNGDADLFAVFRTGGQESRARVALPRTAHVVDLRRRRDLGSVRSLETTIRPSRATFYVALPTEPSPARLSLRAPSLRRGQVGQALVRVPGASGVRSVLVTARTPQGRPAPWLRSVVMVPPKGATVPVPMAFNDPPGKWTLEARELFSGKTTLLALSVR